MKKICILGCGISALALADNLKKDAFILEKSASSSGLCSTIIENGFTFDIAGPHILFSKNKNVLKYMVDTLGENVDIKYRNSKVLYKNNIVKYPFENGLSDLPKEECFECIRDYINNDFDKNPKNLEEWAYATFGKSISEKYFIPYNEKIWNRDANKISLDLISRIPKPPVDDVLRSAIGINTEGIPHQLNFYYPKNGGFQSLTEAFTKKVSDKIIYNEEILELEKIKNYWQIKTKGSNFTANTVVSTIPIHKLVKLWKNCPKEILNTVSKLKFNGLINVLIGFKNNKNTPYSTVYIPDKKVPFHRLTFLKNFSENCVPDGYESVMAEITANSCDDLWRKSNEEIISLITKDLENMGFLSKENVVYAKVIKISYAYPVYDLNYNKNINKIHSLIKNEGIHLLGRFGRFEYINSDVCVEQALVLADQLNM